MHELIKQELLAAQQSLQNFILNPINIDNINYAADLMTNAIKHDKKIIACGNGGSMCDAMHFAEELSGRFRDNRKPLPALALSDSAYISCVANDYGYEQVFGRMVEAFGKKGDVLLAISTSGNSPNVLKAAKVAQEHGLTVVALTGKDGGELANLAHVEIRAPQSDYADRAQEIHIKVIHCLIFAIEQKLLF